MKNQQSGFTLIELIMVVVILGILAAVAVPRYIDMSDQAALAATQGVAGALSAGAAVNYAARQADATGAVPVATCGDVANTLEGGLPDGYEIVDPAATADCEVRRGTAGVAVPFTIIIVS